MRQTFQSTKQLFWMKNVLLKQGINCIYLSRNLKESQYHMRLMSWLFRCSYLSLNQGIIRYPEATLYFKTTSNHPDTLKGYKASIIADHDAFITINSMNEYQEFLDIIKHSKRHEHP